MLSGAKKNILELEPINKQVNTFDTDYKSEMVVADLIEQGYNPDQLLIIREGAARRGFAKDIEEIRLNFSMHDLLDYVHIITNKESIYDILPEGLFHQPVHKKNRMTKDKEDILDEIKLHREEEFFARKFFQLFEIELDRMLVEINLYEVKYDKKVRNPNFINIFLTYWPVLKLLQRKQAIVFMQVIPILHKVRNRHAEVAEIMSLILEVPIKLTPIKLPAKEASNYFESRIGESRLGVDWVLGKSFDDGKYDVKITVGPISAKKMEYFLETSVGNTILDSLCNLFMSSDMFYIKEFKILPEDAEFILSCQERTTYLGINTFI